MWKGTTKKPYYLNDEMQFMVPFLSRRGRVIQINKDNFDVSSLDNLYSSPVRFAPEDSEQQTKSPSEDQLDVVETVTHELPDDKALCKETIRIKLERIDEPETQDLTPPTYQDQPSSSSAEKESICNEKYTPNDPEPPKKKLRAECSCLLDPDQQFLLSLKPDLEQMNMEQKRRFKRGIFGLLADIMDNDHRSHPSPSPSSTYR